MYHGKMSAMSWLRSALLVLAGFVLAFVVMIGTVWLLISLPSRFLPPASPPGRTFTPPVITPGESLPGRAEGHVYDIRTSPGGLSATFDGTIAEALVDSLMRQSLNRLQNDGLGPVRIQATGVSFTDDGLYMTVDLSSRGFDAGDASHLTGDAGLLVERIEMLDGGYRAEMELSFGEDLLNSFLARRLPRFQEENELPLRASSVKVSFREGRMMAVTTLEVPLFGEVDVGVRLLLGVREGWLDVVLEDVDLGRLPLPGPVEDQINGFIEQGIASLETQDFPVRLREIRLQGGRMEVRAVVEIE